jgi:hypothetical protein
MKIQLTPGQAVTVHGWIKARKILMWGDVLANDALTFKFLTQTCKIPVSELQKLQPDIEAWVQNERAHLEDLPDMVVPWSTSLTQSFKTLDISDIIRMRWDAKTLQKLGVTYRDLCELGLTPDNMPMLGLSLHSWSSIGLTRNLAKSIPVGHLERIFRGMTWQGVLASLPESK